MILRVGMSTRAWPRVSGGVDAVAFFVETVFFFLETAGFGFVFLVPVYEVAGCYYLEAAEDDHVVCCMFG